jgi:hypothetical protein
MLSGRVVASTRKPRNNGHAIERFRSDRRNAVAYASTVEGMEEVRAECGEVDKAIALNDLGVVASCLKPLHGVLILAQLRLSMRRGPPPQACWKTAWTTAWTTAPALMRTTKTPSDRVMSRSHRGSS